jgi:sigma-E factor negative regulatory protein RseB
MPDPQAVVAQQAPAQFWPSLDVAHLAHSYRLASLGEDRVAGRPTQIIGISPKDRLRYGYRFYLDQETGLPLKTDLMGEAADPLEQIMFTTLGFGVDPPPTNEQGIPAGYQIVRRITAPQLSHTKEDIEWVFTDLPMGFALRGHCRWTDPIGAQVEQLLVTDGLASISVYIEASGGEGLHGAAQIGTINAWGRRMAGQQITAVGEVPSATVRQVVEALQQHSMQNTP